MEDTESLEVYSGDFDENIDEGDVEDEELLKWSVAAGFQWASWRWILRSVGATVSATRASPRAPRRHATSSPTPCQRTVVRSRLVSSL